MYIPESRHTVQNFTTGFMANGIQEHSIQNIVSRTLKQEDPDKDYRMV